MIDIIDRKAFYRELSKKVVRDNMTVDDYEYMLYLLMIQPGVIVDNLNDINDIGGVDNGET